MNDELNGGIMVLPAFTCVMHKPESMHSISVRVEYAET
jgi:hypothetical protein